MAFHMRPSPRLSTAGACCAAGRQTPCKEQHPPRRPTEADKTAGMPSWALNEGLEGHRSGPDACFVGPHEPTAARVVVHQGENGVAENKSSYSASIDERQLLRATRRQAKPDKKRFARQGTRPEDESVVEDGRRRAQEDEWRRILRRQRGVPSSVTTASDAQTQASILTAGFHSHEVALRAETSKRTAYGKRGIAILPGDVFPRGPPLPLAGYSTGTPLGVVDEVESQVQQTDGLDRLSHLLQMGTRP